MTASKPAPRPGILDISPYVPGKSGAASAARSSSFRPTSRRSGRVPRHSRAFAAASQHMHLYPGRIGDAIAPGDCRALRAQCRSHRVRGGFGRAHPAPGPWLSRVRATRRCTRARVPGLSDRDPRQRGGSRWWRRSAISPPTLMPDSERRESADPHGVSGQSQQSDRHLSAVQGGEEAACGRCRPTACWCSMQPMPNMSAAMTMKPGIELVFDHRQCGDDANLLESIQAWRRSGSAGPIARSRSPTCSTGFAGRSMSAAPAIAAAVAALKDAAHLERAIAHNDRWLPWLTQEIAALGYEVTPSAGNFLLVHFPGRSKPQCRKRRRGSSALGG